MEVKSISKQAYRLIHDGILALAEVEQNGIHVDTKYCEEKQRELSEEVGQLEIRMEEYEEVKLWKRKYKHKFNLDSDLQLSHILYKELGIRPTKLTEKENASVDQSVLAGMDLPMVKDLLHLRKLKKAKNTYLKNIVKESWDGVLYPSFNLHTVRTFRSCVAEGSKVLVVRDFRKHPTGVPIEQVRQGDYVYCFDDNLNPAIGRVSWSGKTGHKRVVRLHWRGNRGRKGYLDVTPDHEIRHISGRYVRADELVGDMRGEGGSRRASKIRVLSCYRSGDSLWFTGHMENGSGILEHRLIYDQLIGNLNSSDVIHHRNKDHLDHRLENLEKTSLSKHSRHHTADTLLTPFGEFLPGNHQVIRIEELEQKVNVYDLEVEEFSNFIANEICVHNSSSEPNWQNLPVRDPVIKKLIRSAITPRLGHRIGGVDYSGIEVKISACMHRDPTMLKYLNDPGSDMHRDVAMDCYMIGDRGQVTKDVRYCGKNQFTFPQFYGDYYRNCAKSLWASIGKMKLTLTDGTSLMDHLREQGIRSYFKFEKHIEDVEYRFWHEKFPVYRRWKETWVRKYERKGWFDTLTGFRCSGVMGKNDVINYPVQGTAFHCLLWSLIRCQRWMKEEDLRSVIIGQIHDEMTMDNQEDEMDMVLTKVRQIMCGDIKEEWGWLEGVPLEIEAEFAPVDKPWYYKERVEI